MCMKSAVCGVAVFRIAIRIHRPISHAGVVAIVGQGKDDAVARSAVRAVDVGISIPSVGRIETFFQAVFADRQIGRDMDCRALRMLALADAEFLQVFTGGGFDLNFRDHRSRGRVTSHLLNERLHVSFGAFQMDLHSLAAVEDPASEAIRMRQAVYKRAKTNPLHHATHTH